VEERLRQSVAASRRPAANPPTGRRATHVPRGRRHRRHGAGRVGRPLSPESPGRTPCRPKLGQEWGLAEGQVRQDPRVPQGIVSGEEGVIVMSRQMFVWRMVRGPRAGEPCENTPGNLDASRVHREISHLEQGPIDYTGALDYVVDELSHRRLRLGWGVANPELDVRLSAWKCSQSVHGGDLRGGCYSHYRRV
jgi:hypothetical protein